MSMPSIPNLNLRTLCREDRLKEALHVLLTTHNPPVNSGTYLQLLQSCISKKALSEGKQIHAHINEREFKFGRHKLLQDTLIHMYDKCGGLVNARKLFDQMTERDVFSWNIIIAAYRRHRLPYEALRLFHQMQQTSVQPDQFTFATVLPACAKVRALEQGIDIHHSVIERGFLSDEVVANGLVDMYAKCGSVDKARELFDIMPNKNRVSWNAMIAGYAQNGVIYEASRVFREMPEKDVVSWTAIIAGYAQNGFAEKALETFKQMQLAGVMPDSTTFASVLPACAKMGALEQGVNIHQSIMERGCLSDVIVANALVDMYSKCGSIHKARNLFNLIVQKNVVSWNSMIAGYAQNCALDEASRLFEAMPQRNVISWNAMIGGYAQNGFVEKAFETFKQMQLADAKPDSTTFASILPVCAKMGALEHGVDFHRSIMERGLSSDIPVANALVDMYTKFGNINKAWGLFEKMPQRNVVSWTAMVAGYAQNGFVERALEIFKQMLLAGVNPDSTTFSSVLPACAKMGALEQGMCIHQSIIKSGFLSDIVANALVDMYAKCGSINKARELFDTTPQKNVISWNAMIAGFAQNGFCQNALELFELMKHSGASPDHVTFASVLLACSHAGLVEEGCKYFNVMGASYCIKPALDHYVRMVDLLGRAGYLEGTLNFIIKMPIKPVVVVWTCLLGVCKAHKNLGLGKLTATLIFELDPKNTSTYVLLSNIYAELGRWDEAQMVRRLMKDRGINKTPGCSWIEDHKMVHAFCVGDRSHPQTKEI